MSWLCILAAEIIKGLSEPESTILASEPDWAGLFAGFKVMQQSQFLQNSKTCSYQNQKISECMLEIS